MRKGDIASRKRRRKILRGRVEDGREYVEIKRKNDITLKKDKKKRHCEQQEKKYKDTTWRKRGRKMNYGIREYERY